MSATDSGTYALVVGMLLSAAPLTIATRVAALLRLNAARWVIRLYVATLVMVVGIDVLLFGATPLALAVDRSSIVWGAIAGVVAIPIAWAIDRTILRSARELNERVPRRGRPAARNRSRSQVQRADHPLLVAIGGGLEELIYRFYLPVLATVLLGAPAGVGISLLLYALIHGAYGWWQVLAKGVMGGFFLVLFALTGTVIAPCIAHAGFNLIATRSLSLRPHITTRLRSASKAELR